MPKTTVADLMSTDVVSLDATQDVVLASTVMKLRKIRHLPVTRQGQLVGLIAHRDLLRAQARFLGQISAGETKRFASVSATEIMTEDVQSIGPDAPAAEAVRILLDEKCGCLPVVNEGVLIGIVTDADFLRFAYEHLAHEE